MYFVMYSAFSFSCNTMLLYTFSERTVTVCLTVSPFSSSFFAFPEPVCFFFLSTQFTEAMEWLPDSPGGHPGASGASPGGGWVKCHCGGWFPLMKYQYFTLLIYCRLTKHDTILSKLGNVYVSVAAFSSPCDDKKQDGDRRYNRFLLHYKKKKGIMILFCPAKTESSCYTAQALNLKKKKTV